jgi:hypothetical protein
MDRQSPVQDSLMREGSSPPSPTSPVFFAPFRNRIRMLTEETIWMQNGTTYQYPSCSTMEMTDANPFTSPEEGDEDEQDDDRSAVSSMSNDSRRRMGPGWDSDETEPKGPPPNEINIPVSITTEVPDWLRDTEGSSDWLKETESSSSSADEDPPPPSPPDLTPILTGGASPTHIRPTMHRNRSSPMVIPFSSPDMRKLPRPTSISRVLTMGSTITGGTSIISKGSGTFISSPEDVSILGNRPRRQHHHRNPSTALSVGSVVGQSSFVTAPSATLTATSGSFSDQQSQSWQHQQNAQRAVDHLVADVTTPAAMAMHTRRNPVKEDMKYIWGRVSTPIRRLTGTDGKVILKRASGCLT